MKEIYSKLKEIYSKLKERLGNLGFLEMLVGTISVIASGACIYFSAIYSKQSSEYYGIDIRYFDGEQWGKTKLLYIVIIIFFLVYTLVILNRNLKTQKDKVACFIQMTCLLFLQNFLYLEKIAVSYRWKWLNKDAVFIFALAFIFLCDIYLAGVLSFCPKEDFPKSVPHIKRKLFNVALAVFLLSAVAVIYINLTDSVTKKRAYETIDQEKVIITCYEGKFLVMDGRIEDDILYITKGKYEFVEMNEKEITYHEYQEVYVE